MHVCAQQRFVELKGLLGSMKEGPGESRAKGVFGLGVSLEVKVPLGGQAGWRGARRKNTLAAQEVLRLIVFACEAVWKHSGAMLKLWLTQRLLSR